MAIAFNTSVDGGLVNPGTSLTWAHTCTGSNLILFVAAFGNTGAAGNVSGVTYNTVAMTQIGSPVQVSGDRWIYLFYLINPATGAHNVVLSSDGTSIAMDGISASYTGVKQSGQPDANTTNTAASTSITTSLTTIADNCWTILVAKAQDFNPAAGTGSTLRTLSNRMTIMDSNAAITPAGNTSMQATVSPSDNMAAIMASFSPFVAASVFKTFKTLLGVGNI